MRSDLLLQLAEHLEKGQLGHQTFDFTTLNDGPFHTDGCGTTGCALGELPILFHDDWKFKRINNVITGHAIRYIPALKDNLHVHRNVFHRNVFHGPYQDTERYFDLTETEVEFLFSPLDVDDEDAEEEEVDNERDLLYGSATRLDVATRIRRFVAGTEVPPNG